MKVLLFALVVLGTFSQGIKFAYEAEECPAGYVDDCARNNWCCPTEWLGDGTCMDGKVDLNCNLSCYEEEKADCETPAVDNQCPADGCGGDKSTCYCSLTECHCVECASGLESLCNWNEVCDTDEEVCKKWWASLFGATAVYSEPDGTHTVNLPVVSLALLSGFGLVCCLCACSMATWVYTLRHNIPFVRLTEEHKPQYNATKTEDDELEDEV